MKIMLVEDEEMLSSVISKGLKKLGYAVDQVYDGDDALFNYSINQYDLIILDLNIPSIDGIDVLKYIRKSDNNIKILILSARSEIYNRILGLNGGCK